jgi:sugar (glycoside-pentoside-hexuronide) transporter
MKQQGNKLPIGIKLGWAVGELAVASYIGLTIAFLLFYATQALGISPWLAGLVLLAPRLWDAFTDPLMGAISDRTKSKMGRRRPYLLLGSILLGLSIAGLFSAPVDASEMHKAMYLLVFYLLASTAITIFDVPYSSMAAEMTNDYEERLSLTGYKMVAARLGILMILFAVPVVFGKGENLAHGFRYVGFGFGAFIIITGLASFFLTKNAPRLETPVGKFSIRDELKSVRDNKPFRALWIVFLFQNLAIGASATTLLYMLTLVINVDKGSIGIFMAISAVSATVFTPIWVVAGRKLAKKKGYYFALVLSALAPIPFLFIQPGMTVFLVLMLLFMGIADASNQLFPNAMVPDTVEVDELRTGERREGAIFGAWAFCRKLGMTAGAFLVSLMLSAFGLVKGASADLQPENAILGVRLSYALLPLALWIIALLLLHRYKLSEEKFNAIKQEIASKVK